MHCLQPLIIIFVCLDRTESVLNPSSLNEVPFCGGAGAASVAGCGGGGRG